MTPKFQIKTKNFSAMVRELSARTGADLHQVLRYEVSRVLHSAMEKTRAASVAKIGAAIKNRPFVSLPQDTYAPRTLSGKKYRDAGWTKGKDTNKDRYSYKTKITKGGYIRYPTGKTSVQSKRGSPEWRYPRALWRAVLAQNQRSIEKRKAARGTAKKSWWKMAHILGLNFDVPQFVAEARTYPRMDVAAAEIKQKASSYIVIRNMVRAATSYHGGGRRALQGAINRRVASYKKGIELRVEQVTRAIGANRGVTVKRAA